MNSTCRLLYLLGQLKPGGQERQLCYLLQAMDRARYQPAIAVWNFSTRDERFVREIQELGVPLYPCSSGAPVASKLAELRRLVSTLQPEVIHSYCFYTNFVAWWISRGSQGISIGSIRQDFTMERRLGGLAGTIGARLSSRLPAVQISNNWAAKTTAEQSKVFFKPNHIYVVANGVDVAKLRPRTASQPGTSLLGIGRLDPEKRWDRLLKATGVLATRRLDFCLRIAGDGLLMNELQMQAKYLGLDGRVQFLGYRPDVPELLKESLFLIHTADAEGCPNAILEAMACGRAVIATDAGDVPNLIENGRTGFLVRRGDDSTLVECIARLINDQQLCRSMGQAGRVKVEREFGLGRLVANTLATYQTIGWNG